VRHVLLLAALLCAAPAQAYVQSRNSSGQPMSWATHGHGIQIDAQGSPDVPGTASFDAVRKSFQTWAAVGCSDLTFPEESLSQDPKARVVGFFQGQTNHNLVLFRTRSCQDVAPAGDPCFSSGGCDNLYDCFDENLKGGVIATTTTTTNSRTGEILDTDTEFNEAPQSDGSRFVFTAVDGPPCAGPTDTGCVQFDIQNTMTHEAGHTLGLDHTPDPNATMFATSPSGETSKRILGQDDINGICAIYPKGAGASAGGCGCSHSQTGPGAALCALLLLLQIRRRSRRKPQLAMTSSVASASTARFHGGSES
jgi:MYXO-CTERM domain-containing protein